MTVHFAAARTQSASTVARILTRRRVRNAANDNYTTMGDDTLVAAALRHFAAHGLRAANDAKEEAERAFCAGDRKRYLWWLGVCRTLDRRISDTMERANRTGVGGPRKASSHGRVSAARATREYAVPTT
ncbi:MAG: hypothetical protein WA948_06070 [Pontixanthobacter sp.]